MTENLDILCQGSFYVTVHDVAPPFVPQLSAIRKRLQPLVGQRVAGAIVPQWHGQAIDGDGEFVKLAGDWFGEILLHGCEHRPARPGWLSLISGQADEFTKLPRGAARQRIERGQSTLRSAFGRGAQGFVAPAWRMGRLTTGMLARHGLRFRVAMHQVQIAGGPTVPASSWSWDWGIIPKTGRLGEAYGNGLFRARPESLPIVVIHPRDVDRGLLPRALRRIEVLLEQGRQPLVMSQVLEQVDAEATT